MLKVFVLVVSLALISNSFAFAFSGHGNANVIRSLSLRMANVDDAVKLYKSKHPSPKANSPYKLDDGTLKKRYAALTKTLFGSDADALEICNIWPEILCVTEERTQDNMSIFVEKFGEEDAIGLAKRNPLLFGAAPYGYGSTSKAGADMIQMSYVIAATRPLGKPLLGFLLLALLKAVIFGPGASFDLQ